MGGVWWWEGCDGVMWGAAGAEDANAIAAQGGKTMIEGDRKLEQELTS